MKVPRDQIVKMLYERGHRDRANAAQLSLPKSVDTVKYGPKLAMYGIDPAELRKKPKLTPKPKEKPAPRAEPKVTPTADPKPEPKAESQPGPTQASAPDPKPDPKK